MKKCCNGAVMGKIKEIYLIPNPKGKRICTMEEFEESIKNKTAIKIKK